MNPAVPNVSGQDDGSTGGVPNNSPATSHFEPRQRPPRIFNGSVHGDLDYQEWVMSWRTGPLDRVPTVQRGDLVRNHNSIDLSDTIGPSSRTSRRLMGNSRETFEEDPRNRVPLLEIPSYVGVPEQWNGQGFDATRQVLDLQREGTNALSATAPSSPGSFTITPNIPTTSGSIFDSVHFPRQLNEIGGATRGSRRRPVVPPPVHMQAAINRSMYREFSRLARQGNYQLASRFDEQNSPAELYDSPVPDGPRAPIIGNLLEPLQGATIRYSYQEFSRLARDGHYQAAFEYDTIHPPNEPYDSPVTATANEENDIRISAALTAAEWSMIDRRRARETTREHPGWRRIGERQRQSEHPGRRDQQA